MLFFSAGFHSQGRRLKEPLQSSAKAYLLQAQGHRALTRNHGQLFLRSQNLKQLWRVPTPGQSELCGHQTATKSAHLDSRMQDLAWIRLPLVKVALRLLLLELHLPSYRTWGILLSPSIIRMLKKTKMDHINHLDGLDFDCTTFTVILYAKGVNSKYGLRGVADWRSTKECLNLCRYAWQCFCTFVLVLILHYGASVIALAQVYAVTCK